MKWLVTTDQTLDEASLDRTLGHAGAHLVAPQAPVPLGPDEKAWQVEGPPNLDVKLADEKSIKEVYPSSEMTPY